MSDEDAALGATDLVQALEAIANEPPRRQPGVEFRGHVRDRRERADQDEGAVASTRRQLDYHPAAQRSAVQDDLLRCDALLPDKPVIGGVRGGVAAGFAGLARASPVAGIVEDQHARRELLLPAANPLAAMAEVAGVAVGVEDRAVRWVPALGRAPPRMDADAVVKG